MDVEIKANTAEHSHMCGKNHNIALCDLSAARNVIILFLFHSTSFSAVHLKQKVACVTKNETGFTLGLTNLFHCDIF